jgi:transposase
MILAQSYVGIDIARSRLDIFDEAHGALPPIANDPAAITALLASLAGRSVTVVFEATGPYDRTLRAALEAARIPVLRVNPGRARDFARAAGYLAKTDTVDARMLAAMGRAIAMPLAEPIDPIREELAALSHQRDCLVAVRAEEKTRALQAAGPHVRASIARHIAWLTQEIQVIEAAIETLVDATPELRQIQSLLETAPGVGPVTAVTLIAHMPELGRRSPKAIAALAGLAPLNNDSGDRRGRRSIRGGRRRVRRALYMAALSAIRAVPRFARAYADIAARAASKKVAIIAVARRLLVALNAMLAKSQPFAA